MAKIKSKYVCQSCGYESLRWIGKCPECDDWNTFVEEIEDKKSKHDLFIIEKEVQKPVPINKLEINEQERFSTCINELDRVLGGGVVRGSLILAGGDPGIGKSTLLIQVAENVAKSGKRVLYASGEESIYQIKMRAKRLNIESENLYIFAENNLDIIEKQIDNIKPEMIIVDSIQTVYSPQITSTPGSVSQIKEGTSRFMKISKKVGISTFIVGHVTKEGSLAGPKILEHMVDAVLYFEGERYNTYRMIRAVKNRFGSTNELGVFEMRDKGLIEVENPSKILISEKPKGVSGSIIVATIEGTRPMLVELQALVCPTSFGIPKRAATGVDYNRVSLIMAVIEKRAGMQIQNQDIYINVVGGIRLNEPAIDLGIVISIASSFRDIEINEKTVAIGEVGLTGEIRGVSFIEKRIAECKKLGFNRIIIPKSNVKGLENMDDIKIIGVENVREALDFVLGG